MLNNKFFPVNKFHNVRSNVNVINRFSEPISDDQLYSLSLIYSRIFLQETGQSVEKIISKQMCYYFRRIL